MGMMTSSSTTSSRAPTFFITDPRMLAHKSEWDPLHIDTPERLKTILELFEKENLISQCELLKSVECSIEDLNLVHSLDHINGIQRASALPDFEQMEALCKGLEDIYVNKYTWDCARLSAGCAVRAMEAVLASGRPDANAFAAIRPPGHHASQKGPCGFCIFNNVAICAKKARSLGVERVLIIDWDVHAAQGTQYCVEGEPGILLISAQRYERGQFWPELPEIGHSHQYRNTINVPLDEIGYGDAEYAAFMHSLVLPLIRQWQPGLILISCGFDAALGDPAGEMEVTPAGFAYMTGLLAQQGIPLVLLLEGGYFLDSVVQGAHFCMRALLKRAPPVQNFCQQRPSTTFLRTIYSILLENAHQFPLFHEFIEKLNSLRFDLGSASDRRKKRQLSPIRILRNEYLGDRKTLQLAMDTQMYPTRGEYSPRAKAITRQFSLRVRQLVEQYAISPMMIERVCIELELGPGGKIFIPKPATNGTSNGWRDVAFRFTSANQFLLFYFYILLPLDFTYFDVQLGGHKLPLNAGQLDEFVDKFQQKQLAMNGHLENGGAGGKEAVTAAELENILDIFAQLKLFFLF